MSELPPGWADAPLVDIAETRLGKMLSAKARGGPNPRPYLRNKNVQWGRFDLSDLLVMDFDDEEFERFRVVPGDLLVCEGGEVGRAAIWRGQIEDVGYQKALHRVRPAPGVSAEYLLYAFRWFADTHAFESFITGSTINHLPQEDIRRLPIPLPPEAEQRRIVAAIEEQFSRIDAAEESLLRAKKRLSLLRSAALTAAVDGDWPIKRLDEIAHTTSGGTPSRRRPDYFGGPIPWVKSGELRDGRVRTTEETITQLGLGESSAKIFERGTLLIALYGATVGKLGILDIDAATNQAVCAIKPDDPEMVPYLWVVLRQKRAELVAAGQGGAQPNISQAILRRLRIPVPPPDEQRSLVEEVERQLSITDAMSAEIERAFRRSAALRRSILEQAFSGKLVPQDPSDEAASALLERIAADRAKAKEASSRRPHRRATMEMR